MPFTNGSPVELTPDFKVDERLANSETLHMMSLRHSSVESEAFIEGVKTEDEDPYYSFGWRTYYSAEDATKLIIDADEIEGLGATSGTLMIRRWDNEHSRYGWGTDMPNEAEEMDLAGLGLAKAALIRLDTDHSTLGWDTNTNGETATPEATSRMWVITADGLLSSWVQYVVNETAEDKTKSVIARNLSKVAFVLATFQHLSFGECTLDFDLSTLG